MSDISLLMTGLLKTRHVIFASVIQQFPVQLDTALQQPAQCEHCSREILPEITPPEFIESEQKFYAPASFREPPENQDTPVQANETLRPETLTPSLEERSFAIPKSQEFSDLQNRNSTSAQREWGVSPVLPTLGFGNSGTAVRVLQRLLRNNGYAIRVDGFFGVLTETAVKAFQNEQNIRVDGIVGSETWQKLANNEE